MDTRGRHRNCAFGPNLLLQLCALLFVYGASGRVLQQEQSSDGFLPELELEPTFTTPAFLKEFPENPQTVRGKQTFTVVFSRPVIALGEDFGIRNLPNDKTPFFLDPPVPGQARWVTTYIYRFDTEGDWPLDSEITFTWNKNLTTHDGNLVNPESVNGTILLKTPSLSMFLSSVKSELASNLTANRWDADQGLSSDKLPEVPPDGLVQLSFSHPVSITVMKESLKVVKDNEAVELGLEIMPCEEPPFFTPIPRCPGRKCGPGDDKSPEETEDICLTFQEDLEVDTRYSLELKPGIKYSEKAGRLKRNLTKRFAGLRLFKIPFFRSPSFGISSPALEMWTPHGLDEDVLLEDLKEVITLAENATDEKVDFELSRPDLGTLRILAPLRPFTAYKVEVSGSSSIKDGFGLPLLPSNLIFRTSDISANVQPMNPSGFEQYLIFEADQDWGRKIAVFSEGDVDKAQEENSRRFCGRNPDVAVWAPVTDSEAQEVLALGEVVSSDSISTLLAEPDFTLVHESNELEGSVDEIDVSSLISKTGAVVYESCRFQNRQPILMVETDIQATMVRSDTMGRIWVTSMKTGKPVKGADVQVFNEKVPIRFRTQEYIKDNLKLVASGITNADGLVELDNLKSDPERVLIKHEGKFLYILSSPRFFSRSSSRDTVQTSLILDRKLVKPAEDLRVKGYFLQPDGLEFSPVDTEIMLEVTPPLNVTQSRDRFPVETSIEFGSFEAVIPIPEDARLRNYRVGVIGLDPAVRLANDRQSFTVGDPRPPTVELTVESPFWVRPNETAKIQVVAESFIGASVGDAEITLSWSISDSSRRETPEEFESEIIITTDENGEGEAEIALGALENQPSPGSRLDIDITWVGPTRELIEKEATIQIELADLSIDLDLTITTSIPGQEFGVRAQAETLQGMPLPGGEIEVPIKLKALKDDFETFGQSKAPEPIDGSVVDECTVDSGDTDYNCRFKLPDVGKFALEACVPADAETTLCRREFLGRTAEDWKERPLLDFLKTELVELSSGPYKVGDTVRYAVENPYANARALVTWGSKLGEQSKVVVLEDDSLSEFTIDVDDTCEASCGVHVTISIPRQSTGVAANMIAPVSKMFDPAAPHFSTSSTEISVKQDRSFAVNVTFPEASLDEEVPVVPPGTSTTIEVSVDADQETEVTVIAVDKAILQLLPYPLQDPASDFEFDLATSFADRNTGDEIVSPAAIETLIEAFKSRKALDPWAFINKVVNPTFRTDIDLTDEEYLDRTNQDITIGPFNGFFGSATSTGPVFASSALASASGGGFAKADSAESVAFGAPGAPGAPGADGADGAPAAPPAARTAIGESTAASDTGLGVAVRLQEQFVSTALFKTTTTKKGIAAVNFTAPDNLGTFVVRAYAATGNGKFGRKESELIVRRTISLTPSSPRFARVGDEFEAGAVVTVSGSDIPVTVSISMESESEGKLELMGDDSKTFTSGSDGQEEVRFLFTATRMGGATFTIRADSADGAQDAVVINIPVEGLQEGVTVASSFAVDGSEGSGWQEGLALPDAVPGSGSVKIQAGVGRMPAVLSLADQIYDTNPLHKCPVSADFALATSVIPLITETYQVLDLDKSVLDLQLGDVIDGIVSNFTAALQSLEELTLESEGLQAFTTCPDARFPSGDPFFSIIRNARAVWTLNELMEDRRNTEIEGVEGEGVATLEELLGVWRSALADGLVKEAQKQRERFNSTISVWSVATARAALGGDWTPPDGTPQEIVDDLSMERLSRKLSSLSVASQAYYILTRLAMENGREHPDVEKAIKEWEDNFRVGGRTAYIAASEGSASPASNEANSLILIAFVRTDRSNVLVEKLANYVGSPPVDDYGFRLFSLHEKVVTMLALREFDVSKGNDQPDLDLKTRSGNITLLSFTFDKSTAPVASSSTPWEELDAPPKPLEFLATGKGQVTIAASLTFVPARLLPFPTFKGIFVQRLIRIADEEQSANAPSLAVVPVGSIVEVTVQMTTPDRLTATTLRVLMPAGLEPVDPNIAGNSRFCPVPFASFFFPVCPTQETRPTVVTFSYSNLRPGFHAATFRAVAATAGTFALPPARAFVDDQPELMGLSSAGFLKVCSGVGCKAEAEKAPATPKTCPNNCSDNGACNLETGTCLCVKGFTGEDCGMFETS